MSVLKVDPSQKKVVALLLVMLVGAICVTVFRTSAAQEDVLVTPFSEQNSKQKDGDGTPLVVVTQADAQERNPFQAPSGMKRAARNADAFSDRFDSQRPQKSAGGMQVAPMEVGALPSADGAPAGASGENGAESQNDAPPSFALQATIKSGKGYCAIIKVGDTQEKVVEVGDDAGSGFKVKYIDADRVVLSDGRTKTIAKRPVP